MVFRTCVPSSCRPYPSLLVRPLQSPSLKRCRHAPRALPEGKQPTRDEKDDQKTSVGLCS